MFKFNGSPHTHIETPLSGSTVDAFIKKAVSLGRSYFSYTDHNYMAGLYKAYALANKNKLGFIAGIEVYFKDPNCKIAQTEESWAANYFKATLYAPNQEIYQQLGALASLKRTDKIVLNGEEYGLWSWSDLENAAKLGCFAASSEINDIVGKHFLLNSPKAGLAICKKMLDLFGDKYRLTIVGNEFDKYAINAIDVTFKDGTKQWFLSGDHLYTNRAKKVKASELLENDKHTKIIGFYKNKIYFSLDKEIKSAILVSGDIRIESGDLQLKLNKTFIALSKRMNIKLLYSDYAYYADSEDKWVQDVRLYSEDKKEYAKRHMQSSEEASGYLIEKLGLSSEDILKLQIDQDEWLSQFGSFKLKYEIRLPEVEGSKISLELAMQMIKGVGRMVWSNPEYVARLKKEMEVLNKNGSVDLLPYFFPIKYVLDEYKKHNKLYGAGRGSAAGSLVLYCMGITNVNPMTYGLSFERFLSMARVRTGAYPDVDTDLPSREILVGKDRHSGFFYGKWGDRASQVSTRTLLRLKSSIKDVNRFFNKGKVESYIETLTKVLPAAPQGVSDLDFVFGYEDSDGNHTPGLMEISDDLRSYTEKKPQEWAVVQKCLGISRQTSVHASAFVLSDRPIKDIVPLFDEEFTQYEAKEVEKAGLIKYDFLVVKQLEDVQLAMDFINKKHSKGDTPPFHFWQDGTLLDILDLPMDADVFKSVWQGETSTIFQLNTPGMAHFTKMLKPETVEDIALVLALYRPGPLDFIDERTGRNMAQEYIERRFSRSKPDMKELADLIPETNGIMVYQEQVSRVSAELGGMQPEDAEELRRVFSKKDKKKSLEMKPMFMKGAVERLGQEKAEKIWGMMETFSRYGFNKSHAVSYAILSYQSMYLKHFFPLEWWAAVLSNASENEFSTELFKYVKHLMVPPDINHSTDQMSIDYEKGKIRAKLGVLRGAGAKSVDPIIESAPYKDIDDFVQKDVAGAALTKRLIHVGAMDSLFPSGFDLLHKMHAYEKAVIDNKARLAIEKGKPLKKIPMAEIDPLYLSLSPLKDLQLKKAIFPTMPTDLSGLYLKTSLKMQEGSDGKSMYSDPYGKPHNFMQGHDVERFEKIKKIPANITYCAVGYVTDMSEFTYSKNTKKALKLVLDFDGNVMERVMWPDYNSEKLVYPKDLKKGSIALVFFSRRAPKAGAEESSASSISDIIVEIS